MTGEQTPQRCAQCVKEGRTDDMPVFGIWRDQPLCIAHYRAAEVAHRQAQVSAWNNKKPPATSFWQRFSGRDKTDV